MTEKHDEALRPPRKDKSPVNNLNAKRNKIMEECLFQKKNTELLFFYDKNIISFAL